VRRGTNKKALDILLLDATGYGFAKVNLYLCL
jgi:hypothetical protein